MAPANIPTPPSTGSGLAWVPVRRGGEAWAARLEGQVIAIARDDNRFVGFMSLAPQGYIELSLFLLHFTIVFYEIIS
jgi:hypothetical protein